MFDDLIEIIFLPESGPRGRGGRVAGGDTPGWAVAGRPAAGAADGIMSYVYVYML